MYEQLLTTEKNKMDRLGILTHMFKHCNQNLEAGISALEMNASQVYAVRSRTDRITY